MTKHSNNKEQAILTAAVEEILEKGYDGARTTSIARRAGVTHAMLHYYFKTKEQLFERIFSSVAERLGGNMLEVFSHSEEKITERIRRAVGLHFDFLADNPGVPLFLVREVAAHPERCHIIQPTIAGLAGTLFPQLQHDLDEAYAAGEIAQVSAAMLVIDILSLNAFAFLVEPLYKKAIGDFLPFDAQFLEQRKQENIEMVMRRLKRQ